MGYAQRRLIAILLVLAVALAWFSSQQTPSRDNHKLSNNAEEKTTKTTVDDANDRIASYTGWLAALTAALVAVSIGQGFFLLRSDKTANINADAARKSANAAMGVALPRFVVTEIRIQRGGGETVEEALERPIQITLVNMGQSAAVMLRECLVFAVADTLPPIPDYSSGRIRNINFGFPVEARNIHQISGAAGGMSAFGEPFGIEHSEFKQIATGPSTLWVYGYIVYRDFLDDVTTKGFCARMDVENEHERFVQDGPEAYSQTKRG